MKLTTEGQVKPENIVLASGGIGSVGSRGGERGFGWVVCLFGWEKKKRPQTERRGEG